MNMQRALAMTALSTALFSSAYADINPMVLINQPEIKQTIVASLIIIHSNAAYLSTQKNKQMTLTLENVEPYITKFTAAPDRKALLSTIDEMINDWAHNKNISSSGTPSATLAGIPSNGNKTVPNYLLELSHPVYDSKHATLTFKVKWTGGSPAPENNTTLTSVSLVVDDGLQVALNGRLKALAAHMLASNK